MCFAPQRRSLFWHLNFQKWSENGVFCTFWLGNVLRATTASTFLTSQLPKAFRGSGVFVHFDLEMCFAPQRRALFPHLNFQKCPRMVCLVHFDLEMCFAPQWRALFRRLNLQKCYERDVFNFFTCTCASPFAPQLRATFHFLFSQMAPHPPL